jgi:hypothetical protein
MWKRAAAMDPSEHGVAQTVKNRFFIICLWQVIQ